MFQSHATIPLTVEENDKYIGALHSFMDLPKTILHFLIMPLKTYINPIVKYLQIRSTVCTAVGGGRRGGNG